MFPLRYILCHPSLLGSEQGSGPPSAWAGRLARILCGLNSPGCRPQPRTKSALPRPPGDRLAARGRAEKGPCVSEPWPQPPLPPQGLCGQGCPGEGPSEAAFPGPPVPPMCPVALGLSHVGRGRGAAGGRPWPPLQRPGPGGCWRVRWNHCLFSWAPAQGSCRLGACPSASSPPGPLPCRPPPPPRPAPQCWIVEPSWARSGPGAGSGGRGESRWHPLFRESCGPVGKLRPSLACGRCRAGVHVPTACTGCGAGRGGGWQQLVNQDGFSGLRGRGAHHSPRSVSVPGSGSWRDERHSIRGRQLQPGAQAGGSERPGTARVGGCAQPPAPRLLVPTRCPGGRPGGAAWAGGVPGGRSVGRSGSEGGRPQPSTAPGGGSAEPDAVGAEGGPLALTGVLALTVGAGLEVTPPPAPPSPSCAAE